MLRSPSCTVLQGLNRYTERLGAIAEFFRLHGLPVALLNKTTRYFDALWSVSAGLNHHALLSELPHHLRDEILVAAHT